ncbi:hypothetical protein [Roseimicrobium sp. ORNL1]|uniref:type II secretion system protein n=1 Tax=Roseimicrobium sp. ORNL1 TaxID=2711231 RepID=UPI0013E203AD|nr:hypothetical protein [Roseimicrobium sp. ORNL1]QIF03923.1 hypothetical protein G5S37_21120 [Roseimicrobium sp. ORNL1]
MRKPEPEVRSLRQNWRKLARAAVFPLLVSIAALWMASSDWRREQSLMQAARPIQAELEMYRQRYQQYPDSLVHIGVVEKEGSPIHYQRDSKDHYILWFGSHLGKSKTFQSSAGDWH